jgi:hypothetical protein
LILPWTQKSLDAPLKGSGRISLKLDVKSMPLEAATPHILIPASASPMVSMRMYREGNTSFIYIDL